MVHRRTREMPLQLSRPPGRLSPRGRDQQGFSLIEVLVVIGIISVLAVIAMPNFGDWRSNQNLKAAAREAFSSFQFARLEAARRDTTVTIGVTAGAGGIGRCMVFVDTNANGLREGSEPLLREMTVPKGITLSTSTLTTYRLNARGFTVNGAAGAGIITLTNGKRSYTVTLTPAGAVQIAGPI